MGTENNFGDWNENMSARNVTGEYPIISKGRKTETAALDEHGSLRKEKIQPRELSTGN